MTIGLTDPIFIDEGAARAHIERVRWPDGAVCPHCGSVRVARLDGEKHRVGLFNCRDCREQFSATVGSVMERSHVPLHKWVLAFHLMAASKKGMSAHQLHRMLHVTYKTAWFMAHRIREAMKDTDILPLGGPGQMIEVDETYYGKRETPIPSAQRKGRPTTKKGKSGGAEKRPIVALVQRQGSVRAVHMPHVTAENVKEFLDKHADHRSHLNTDESRLYPELGKKFRSHETVRHSAKEYVRGEVHTNTVEGFFGIFKRGMKGIYQHCGEQHLQRYLDEFSFRYSNRIRLGVDDTQRALLAIRGAEGKRLVYRGSGATANA